MRVVVIGGGILGMAAARAVLGAGAEVTVVEKEDDVACHQTGRDGGVVHAGLCYSPAAEGAPVPARGRPAARLLRRAWPAVRRVREGAGRDQ